MRTDKVKLKENLKKNLKTIAALERDKESLSEEMEELKKDRDEMAAARSKEKGKADEEVADRAELEKKYGDVKTCAFCLSFFQPPTIFLYSFLFYRAPVLV